MWHTVGVDLVGPLPVTARGNRYIMTVSCLFSKWPEATALPDKTASGVSEFLFQCFCRHGCCSVKISDQGREFVNEVVKEMVISTVFIVTSWCSTSNSLTLLLLLVQVNDELCQMMGVQCNVTSAYHPQSNGLDERFNQTLQLQLLKYVEEDQSTWDLFLDIMRHASECRT